MPSPPEAVVYSLVSASLLALDLVRHPSGAAVADTVDRVLSLTDADVHALAGAVREPSAGPEQRYDARVRVLSACAREPRLSEVMRGVADTVAEGLPQPGTARTLAQTLATTRMGGLPDLLDLLRRELPLADPALPTAGVQAALDAVAVAWAGRLEDVDMRELALLRAPWTACVASVPPPLLPEDSYGRQGKQLRALLEELSRLDARAWDRVAAAADGLRGQLAWSTAMHEASRVAADSGRLHAVARAQLAAARALRLAGVSTTPAASAAAMAVTAAVQATCVQDLLAAPTAETLRAAWEAGRPGPNLPA